MWGVWGRLGPSNQVECRKGREGAPTNEWPLSFWVPLRTRDSPPDAGPRVAPPRLGF